MLKVPVYVHVKVIRNAILLPHSIQNYFFVLQTSLVSLHARQNLGQGSWSKRKAHHPDKHELDAENPLSDIVGANITETHCSEGRRDKVHRCNVFFGGRVVLEARFYDPTDNRFIKRGDYYPQAGEDM